jgi:transcriptional regulator with XRE-family HTH domain
MHKKNPNKEYKMKVGENIRIWRDLKGLKQVDLAKKIGISKEAMSNIETGESKPNIERLEDIADALEIEVSQLLTNPQQMFTFNNSPQSNGVIYGSNTQSNIDKDLLDRLVSVMEKITCYLTVNSPKNSN